MNMSVKIPQLHNFFYNYSYIFIIIVYFPINLPQSHNNWLLLIPNHLYHTNAAGTTLRIPVYLLLLLGSSYLITRPSKTSRVYCSSSSRFSFHVHACSVGAKQWTMQWGVLLCFVAQYSSYLQTIQASMKIIVL